MRELTTIEINQIDEVIAGGNPISWILNLGARAFGNITSGWKWLTSGIGLVASTYNSAEILSGQPSTTTYSDQRGNRITTPVTGGGGAGIIGY